MAIDPVDEIWLFDVSVAMYWIFSPTSGVVSVAFTLNSTRYFQPASSVIDAGVDAVVIVG
jgi:hypothetical protein